MMVDPMVNYDPASLDVQHQLVNTSASLTKVSPSTHRTPPQVLGAPSSNSSVPQPFKGMGEDEVLKASGVLNSGVHCLALFKEKDDEREMVHLFSQILAIMEPRDIMDMFSLWSDDLVSLGSRRFEFWIDNLKSDFLGPSMAYVMSEKYLASTNMRGYGTQRFGWKGHYRNFMPASSQDCQGAVYVLKRLPIYASKEWEETSQVLTQVLRVVNNVDDANSEARRQLALRPPLLKLTQELVSFLQEALQIAEADETQRMDARRTSSEQSETYISELGTYQNLSMPLLQGLDRLLELLSNWFNVTLGDKLLEYLKKWLEPKELAHCQKSSKVGEEPKIAAAIIDLFHLFPSASGKFLDKLGYVHNSMRFWPAFEGRTCEVTEKILASVFPEFVPKSDASTNQGNLTPPVDVMGEEGIVTAPP
ncbi:phosphotransferases/inositol or phosphatidylinositol kinase [Actinidia rufa]|uniref:Phosphotransferases/inositol or phosphatidylinositol kinase n=1 Tax=Actinidia rufa TaxID=165716 RepID=A0A7J0EP54_9ERIC|nr:phosphotransferases/inositol or phosphatidylinositol kinase [Actinidia rufa]